MKLIFISLFAIIAQAGASPNPELVAALSSFTGTYTVSEGQPAECQHLGQLEINFNDEKCSRTSHSLSVSFSKGPKLSFCKINEDQTLRMDGYSTGLIGFPSIKSQTTTYENGALTYTETRLFNSETIKLTLSADGLQYEREFNISPSSGMTKITCSLSRN